MWSNRAKTTEFAAIQRLIFLKNPQLASEQEDVAYHQQLRDDCLKNKISFRGT